MILCKITVSALLLAVLLCSCKPFYASNNSGQTGSSLQQESELESIRLQLEEALGKLSSQNKESQELDKLNKVQKGLLAEQKTINEKIVSLNARLKSENTLSNSERKGLQAELLVAEADKAKIDKRLAALSAEQKQAIDKFIKSPAVSDAMKKTIQDLRNRISELEKALKASDSGTPVAGDPESGNKPAPEGQNYSTLVNESNGKQCLSLKGGKSPALDSCGEISRMTIAGGLGGPLQFFGTDLCLGVDPTSKTLKLASCNKSPEQEWNFRYRTGANSFRIENAKVLGAANEVLCLRGDAAGIFLDSCTSQVIYFLKETVAP